MFLGLADLALLSLSREKNMLVVFYDNEKQGAPKCVPILQLMNEFLSDDYHKFEVEESPDMSSPVTWVAAGCRGDFKRGPFLHMNHYVPAYPKVQLGEEWPDAVSQIQDRSRGDVSHGRYPVIKHFVAKDVVFLPKR